MYILDLFVYKSSLTKLLLARSIKKKLHKIYVDASKPLFPHIDVTAIKHRENQTTVNRFNYGKRFMYHECYVNS